MAAFAVIYEGNRFSLDDAEPALRDHGISFRRESDLIVVEVEDGLEMRLALNTEPDVLVESAEMAEYNEDNDFDDDQKKRLAKCDCRYEVYIASADLPAIADETNVMMGVQFALSRMTQGFVFRDWNGEMSAPEDFSTE